MSAKPGRSFMNRLTALALFALIAACTPSTNTASGSLPAPAASEDGLAPPTSSDISLHVRASQNGQVVHVPVNQRFAVELVGVPTAGYQWAPTQLPVFLTRVGDEATGPTLREQTQPGYAGGNHWEVYVFAATEAGSGDLILEQRRPFEHGGPAAATFRVTIVAR
jgi:predicted secreted protein